MKLRYLFIAVLFALLVSVWAARTQLAEVAAASVMQRSGVSDVTVSIRQLDPGQSQIERLAFSLENESGVLQLEAHDARISYTLAQLAEARVDDIRIDRLVLRHEKTEHTTAELHLVRAHATQQKTAPLKIMAAVQQALSTYAIFNHFTGICLPTKTVFRSKYFFYINF